MLRHFQNSFSQITSLNLIGPVFKKLLRNFFSLSLLQVTSFVISLLIIPYLIRSLGTEKFGLIMYSQAMMTFFAIFTDYGFNLSATRDVALNRENPAKIAEIVNTVLVTKFFLFFIGLLLLVALLLIFPTLKAEKWLYLGSYSIVLGQILFPVWYYQGIEKMKYIAILSALSKVLYAVATILFIKHPSDYIFVNLFLGFSGIAMGVVSIIHTFLRSSITFFIPKITTLIIELKQGWYLFISNFSINIYLNSNILLLGIFAPPSVVGQYSVAEKLFLVFRQLLTVFSQVIYPHICHLASDTHQKVYAFFRKVFPLFLSIVLMVSILVFAFNNELVYFLTKSHDDSIGNLIRIAAFIPLIVALNIPVYQTMLANNLGRDCSKVLIAGSLISILTNLILSHQLFAVGTFISILITETFITFGLYYILERKTPHFSLFTHNKLKYVRR